MHSKKSLLLAILSLAVVTGTIFAGNWIWTNSTTDGTKILNSVEIREYKGEKLGAVKDFRENSISGPQNVDVGTYRLAITGLVQNETTYTYNETVDKYTHYEKVVTIYCVEGWEVKILWEGVLLRDLLEEAGYDRSAEVVIFYAQDGYSTSLPLSYVMDNDILIAYKMNGVVLPPERGFPFQLVAESKYGYKWIKWITRIEVSNDTSYRGYWESRGFDNNADLP
jgi:DMSO/TMAO reductase YedYZ molybdopterin-dependent catalytic subunit